MLNQNSLLKYYTLIVVPLILYFMIIHLSLLHSPSDINDKDEVETYIQVKKHYTTQTLIYVQIHPLELQIHHMTSSSS